MSPKRRRHSNILALSLMMLGALFAGLALAGKPGGGGSSPPPGPVPPGTIYFSGWVSSLGNDGYYQPMTMKGDGSDKRNAFSTNSPSYQKHGESRWFFYEDYDWDGPVDEFGFPIAWELYAVNEQNEWIQLTGDPNIHLSMIGSAAWAKDDSFVTYPAWWFTGPEEWNVQGGLFVITIDWSSGVPVASAPTLLFEAEAVWFDHWNGNVNIDSHDWAPGGNAVVFYKEIDSVSAEGTYIADFTGGPAQIRPLTASSNAVWSPDGSRIAFGNGEIWTIKPDGTNPVRLTQRTVTKSETRSQGGPSWSPDGAYIAYVEAVSTKSASSYAIWRIPAGGGSSTNLTSDLIKAAGPTWRP